MNDALLFFILPITILAALGFIKYLYHDFKIHGFMTGNAFIATAMLLYIFVPISYITFSDKRDYSTLFNRLIASNTNDQFSIALIECAVCIALMIFFYALNYNKGRLYFSIHTSRKSLPTYSSSHWQMVGYLCSKKIKSIADVTFMLGSISQIVLVVASGGVSNYIALGNLARGVGKEISLHISSNLLPLITISSVILVSPYLYQYLMKCQSKLIHLKICFYISMSFSILFLLFNQGRLPLILFFAPFIMNMKIARKAKLSVFIVLVIICFPVLNILVSVFTYLSYDYWPDIAQTSFMETLLYEFTYPFSNFLNKNIIIDVIGYRWGLDYIQWPLLLIPGSFLGVVGISKASLTTVGALNTKAYEVILSTTASGGIPADFLFFNYAQFGVLSLSLFILLFMRVLRAIDKVIISISSYNESRIIILRICFLIVSIVNNFDFAVIARMRADLIVLIAVVIIINRSHKRVLQNDSQDGYAPIQTSNNR